MELSVADKVRLLREITRSADDVFALRKLDGNMKWGPVRAKLSDENLIMHMQGLMEIGNYPLISAGNDDDALLPHDMTWWIAADFDSHSRPGSVWQNDTRRTVSFLAATGASLLVNLSRSADGAHVRVLFKEPVPAWMARRWMTAWLVEAEVAPDDDGQWPTERDVPSSFDRTVPMQDVMPLGLDPRTGRRYIGNLIGAPLHRGHAIRCGGTLPLGVSDVIAGDLTPAPFASGRHWEHAVTAVEGRTWGVAELREQLADAPGDVDLDPPDGAMYLETRALPIFTSPGAVAFTGGFCEFMKYMRHANPQPYDLWLAMAANLHAFGDDGLDLFHDLSQSDSRYQAHDADRKWQQTSGMHPVRCDTIATLGYRCQHLNTNRCGGAMAPAYLYEMSRCQPVEEVLELVQLRRAKGASS